VAYVDTAFKGVLQKFNGTAWGMVGSPFGNVNTSDLAIAIDSQDRPVVAFVASSLPTVVRFDGLWQTIPQNGLISGRYIGMALDSHDAPYIVYQNLSGQTLEVKKFNTDSASWEDVGKESLPVGAVNSNLCIALDKNNVPYVTYQLAAPDYTLSLIKFDGSSWQSLGNVVGVNSGVNNVNLKLNSKGVPYVSFWISTDTFLYKFDNNAALTQMGLISPSGNAGLGIDSQDHLYIAYKNPNTNQSLLKKYNIQNNDWLPVGDVISNSAIEMTSIAFDSQDQPYVACKDQVNGYYPRLYACKTYYDLSYAAGDHGDVTGSLSQTVGKGKAGTSVTAVPDDHYHFVKWSDNLNTATRTDSNVQSDITTAAVFSIDTHTVTFNSQGGSTVNAKTADYNTTIPEPDTPAKKGYGFGGWYPTSACDTTPVTFPYTVTYNTEFFAKWNIKNYTVTFDSQGGSTVNSKTADYNTSIAEPDVPVKAGSDFGGWCPTRACDTAPVTFPYTVTDDATLYAKWNVNGYTVTFDSQGGSSVNAKTADYNTTIAEPDAPAKKGHGFGGWYPTPACDTAPVTFPYTVTCNTTLYAKWNIMNYTVAFDSQGGSTVPAKTADYNTTITAPGAPTKASYIFEGWYKEKACTSAWNFTEDKVTDNTTLYAKWKSNQPSANLCGITVSKGVLSPAFKSSKLNYTLKLQENDNSVIIKPEKAYSGAVMTIDNAKKINKNVNLENGKTTTISIKIVCGKVSKTYKVTVIRAKSTNNKLSGIKISAGVLSPAFKQDVTGYTLTLPKGVNKVTIKAVRSTPLEKITPVSKTYSLKKGKSVTGKIKVTSQSGTVRTYRIKIISTK
jgi:uncharacterized repeat protein (TIGR02543 family)